MTPIQEYRPQPPRVLTIAGSDSGGAAGLQADLKTFTTLGVYGMSAITVITAQNSEEISAIQPLPSDLVAAQIDAVLSDYGAQAVKSGFIGSAETIRGVASCLVNHKTGRIVVDPVLVDHRGRSMFEPSVASAYIKHLFPLADLITPNLNEAQILLGSQIASLPEFKEAAHSMEAFGAPWVLIKGWRQDDWVIDILSGQGTVHEFRTRYIDTFNTHGSGDTLSAAICCFLASGYAMIEAVEKSHSYTNMAINKALEWRLGRGHGPLYHGQDNLS